MKKKALFVGVNDYKDDEIRNLHYALDDARSLHDIFEELGYKTAFLKNPGQGEILSQVRKMTEGLSVGDQFVFYFSGHGFTDDGQHLLFCVDDVYANLRYKRAGMPFELLEEETRKCGCDRVFMLDACRSDFLTGTRGADTTTKDLCPISHMVPKGADAIGAFYVLRSCSRYEHAFEIDKKQHGLFTLAMMEVIRESKNTGSQLLFNDMLRETVEERMSQIARNVGLSVVQTPESEVRGRAQILINGRNGFSGVYCHSVPSLVTCPICGKRNKIEDTFKCRQCGSDNLCLRHQDEKTFLCFNCAEKGAQKVVTVVEERKEVKTNSGTQSAISCNSGEGNPSRRPVPMRGYWCDEGVDFPSCSDMALQFFWRACYLKTEEYAAIAFNTFMCADLEDAEIQYRIGLMLDRGWMGDNRRDEAIKWYKAAANQGHYMGLHGIAVISRRLGLKEEEQKGYKLALASMYDAAEKGDGRAMYHIGRYLRFGYIDGYENPKEGISWWEKSSELGNAEAQYWLSKEYENGSFIGKNIGKSFLLCKAAAEGGYVCAMSTMGKFFEVGVPDVIEINLKEALKWYQFSSERDRGLSIDDINRVTRLLKG